MTAPTEVNAARDFWQITWGHNHANCPLDISDDFFSANPHGKVSATYPLVGYVLEFEA